MEEDNPQGIELGDKLRHKTTGLEGICIGIHDWLHGCRSVTIQPQTHKDGEPAKTFASDIQGFSIAEKKSVPPPKKKVVTGGPVPNVTRPNLI